MQKILMSKLLRLGIAKKITEGCQLYYGFNYCEERNFTIIKIPFFLVYKGFSYEYNRPSWCLLTCYITINRSRYKLIDFCWIPFETEIL